MLTNQKVYGKLIKLLIVWVKLLFARTRSIYILLATKGLPFY